jgi:hypothetical protein
VEPVSQALCATLLAGTTYGLKLDLASLVDTTNGGSPVVLEIWGATGSCAQGELLWTSATPMPSWQSYCATLTPTRDTTYLTLVPRFSTGLGSALLLDHLVPVARCP